VRLIGEWFSNAIMIAIEIFQAGVLGPLENFKSKFDDNFSIKVCSKNFKQGLIDFF